MSWVLTIAGICALIVLHEFGHLVVAKLLGVRVERFSLFFPPKLFGVKLGETEYSVGAIPMGGYVTLAGMTTSEVRNVDLRDVHRTFARQAPWRRIAIIAAGPVVNILIAVVLFWALLFSGSVNGTAALSRLNPSIEVTAPTANVAAVSVGSVAAAPGGLRAGDKILAVNGYSATLASVRQATDADRCLAAPVQGCKATRPLSLVVLRAHKRVNVSLAPRYDATAQRMLLGFMFSTTPKHFNVFSATTVAFSEMALTSKQLVTGLANSFTDSKTRQGLSSIVGITQVTEIAVAHGAGLGLVVLAFVSLALAIINLLPFLPLDGGHIAWAAADKVRGHTVSAKAMWRFSGIGMIFLIFLVANGAVNDISRLLG